MADQCFYCRRKATVDDAGIPAWAVDQVGLTGSRVEHLVATGERQERPNEAPVDSLAYGTLSHPELGATQPTIPTMANSVIAR